MSRSSSDRRDISIKGTTYAMLKKYAEERHVSMGGLIQEWLDERLDELKVPVPELVLDPPGSFDIVGGVGADPKEGPA